jgi:hypothetical protein
VIEAVQPYAIRSALEPPLGKGMYRTEFVRQVMSTEYAVVILGSTLDCTQPWQEDRQPSADLLDPSKVRKCTPRPAAALDATVAYQPQNRRLTTQARRAKGLHALDDPLVQAPDEAGEVWFSALRPPSGPPQV